MTSKVWYDSPGLSLLQFAARGLNEYNPVILKMLVSVGRVSASSLSSLLHLSVHNPHASNRSISSDSNTESHMIPGAPPSIVKVSPVTLQSQNSLVFTTKLQGSFILIEYSCRIFPCLRKLWVVNKSLLCWQTTDPGHTWRNGLLLQTKPLSSLERFYFSQQIS